MTHIRTPQALGEIISKRLSKVYLDGENSIHVDKHQVPFAEWLLFWMAQPLTPDNPVDMWDDMDSDEELDHYGYEGAGGDGEDEALVAAIFEAAGVKVPAEWPEWDGMGEPAWLDS